MADRQLTVTARPPGGFRRCGRRWPAEATTVPAGRFTDDQIAALKAEPNLVVQDDGGQGGQGQDGQGQSGQDNGKGGQGKGNQGQQAG